MAYHPESNGSRKRPHQTLAEYLRYYINSDRLGQVDIYAMFAFNTTLHTATVYISFELVYGNKATLSTALSKTPGTTYSYDDYA